MHQSFQHHLSQEARNRRANPMKTISKLVYGRADLVNLANGDPHHSLYPLTQIDFRVPLLDCDDPVRERFFCTDNLQTLSTYQGQLCGFPLQDALQYGSGKGHHEPRQTLKKMNELVHSPPNNTVILTLGNADGISKCFRLLGEPGDSFLAEEFSFPGMTNAPLAQGIKWIPVRMDREGMLPESLDEIMRSWDEITQGRKPHVLYTIPTGQNPTGGTLSVERRREIYRLACTHDIIILEDDPYYFLQYDRRCLKNGLPSRDDPTTKFLNNCPPSFLSMDVQGRVIRIDSFSKIITPGMRLGWITSTPFFTEKLEVLTDSSTQHPHGIGQVFITELFSERGWGFDGFFKWISCLSNDYQRRRELFLSTFSREMAGRLYATVNKPTAGMFIWIEIHYEKHPRFLAKNQRLTEERPSIESMNTELMQKIFDAGAVLMPAQTFAITSDKPKSKQAPIRDRLNFFRATFAGTDETIIKGVTIFCKAVKEFFSGGAAEDTV